LPTLPYEVAIVHYPEEDIDDPWLRIEIMVYEHMTSRDVLGSACEHAWLTLKTVRRLSEKGRQQHPISMLIPRAKSKVSQPKKVAMERIQRGETDFERLIEEEWQKADIQFELRHIIEKYSRSQVTLKRQHLAVQKKVYDRVRRWFPDPKPKVSVKGEWRSRLPLPN
jgi:hypothetical protein